jgi:hypothetical protein
MKISKMVIVAVLISLFIATSVFANENWNRGDINPLRNGNVEYSVSLLDEDEVLKDSIKLTNTMLKSPANNYGGPYFFVAKLKGYSSISEDSTLGKMGFKYKIYVEALDIDDDLVLYTTDLFTSKDTLIEDTQVIVSGYLTGQEIIDRTNEYRKQAEELLQGIVSEARRKQMLEYILSDNEEALSYLPLSDALNAQMIKEQIASVNHIEKYHVISTTPKNIVFFDSLASIDNVQVKDTVEEDFNKLQLYFDRISAVSSMILNATWTQNVKPEYFDWYMKSYTVTNQKIAEFKQKYPADWNTVKDKFNRNLDKKESDLNTFKDDKIKEAADFGYTIQDPAAPTTNTEAKQPKFNNPFADYNSEHLNNTFKDMKDFQKTMNTKNAIPKDINKVNEAYDFYLQAINTYRILLDQIHTNNLTKEQKKELVSIEADLNDTLLLYCQYLKEDNRYYESYVRMKSLVDDLYSFALYHNGVQAVG